MIGIGKETAIFLEALLAGVMVIGVYDCIRIFRRIIPHNLAAVTVEDFLYWTGMAFFLFIKMYETSDGSIRWFFVLGTFAGMLVFHWVFIGIGRFLQKWYMHFRKKKKDKS